MAHIFSMVIAVSGASVMFASQAQASIITYRTEGVVQTNSMTIGDYASAAIGTSAILEITIETTTTPFSTTATTQSWQNVPGLILSIKTIVDGVVSISNAGTPTLPGAAGAALIYNDKLSFSGSNSSDLFHLETSELGSSTAFGRVRMYMLRSQAGPTSFSSLSGVDFPTTAAELDPSTFNATYIDIWNPDLSGRLRASIDTLTIVPAPASLFILGGLLASRRRRN